MRNYEREYLLRDINKVIDFISKNNKSIGNAIDVYYGKLSKYDRFKSLILECRHFGCTIDTVEIRLRNNETGFDVYVHGSQFENSFFVEYVHGFNNGENPRRDVMQFLYDWCHKVYDVYNGKRIRREMWLLKYYETTTNVYSNMARRHRFIKF